MNINFIVNPVFTYGKSGWKPDDVMLGGTEESVVEWATEIKRLGHDIKVYYNGEPGEWYGVDYLPYSSYGKADIDINFKYSEFEHINKAWYFTNELDADRKDLSGYIGVIFPSIWAAENLLVNNLNVKVVPHGYNPEALKSGSKMKNQCFYASSPDRGLEDLREIWGTVVDSVPSANLIVTYNGSLDAPNVTCLGKVDNDTMDEIYRTSQFWLHPANGGELFCMTGVKAQVAECIPVYYPTMALQETVRHGIKTDKSNMANDLIEIMHNREKQEKIRAELRAEAYPDWAETTKLLLEVII